MHIWYGQFHPLEARDGATIMAGSPYAFLNSAVAIALTTARQLPFPTVEVVKCIIAEILEVYAGAVLVS